MRESWYVVPAAFALRDPAKARDEEQTSWLLPESWRGKSQTLSTATRVPSATSRTRRMGSGG